MTMFRLNGCARNYAISFMLMVLCLASHHPVFAEEQMNIRDFLIQDVCIDSAGTVLSISPLDKSCTHLRNLKPNELLPYHKHDWSEANSSETDGYQRSDSVALLTRDLGEVIISTFDFGDGIRRVGFYDGENGDGFGLFSISEGWAGSMMTLDRSGGPQLFVDLDRCSDKVSLASIMGGWRFGPSDLTKNPSGTTLQRIKRVNKLGVPCPTKGTFSTTHWFMTDFKPMSRHGEAARSLKTLVSEHYAGDPAKPFKNMERMYFSRDLGRMRWERWQNLSSQPLGNEEPGKEMSEKLEESGRCNGGEGRPHYEGLWSMVRCREWTNIIPASFNHGDRLSEWLKPIMTLYPQTPIGHIDLSE